jgi:chitinase
MAYICLYNGREVKPCTPVGECHRTSQYLRDVLSCSTFYQCFEGLKKLGKFECDPGLVFDTTTNMCDWPENVDCPY